MNKFSRIVFWTIAFFLLAKTNVSADTSTFQQGSSGYNSNACATLDRWNPDTNTGSNANLWLRPEIQEPIIKFDLSSLSTDALVQNAHLKLFVISNTNANPLTVNVFKVLRNWNELQTTWHKADNSTDWSWVGANGSFIDRYGFPVASQQFTTANIYYEMDITPLVRDWVRNPQTNKGVVLLSESPGSVAYSLGSNNNTNPARRPILTVDYSISPTNDYFPTINITAPANDAFLSGNVNISVNATDDHSIQQVNYLLDDSPFANVAVSPYSYNWNTGNHSVGKHILKAVVVDSNGQTSESAIAVNLYQIDNNILTVGQITDTHVGTSISYEPADKSLYTQRFQAAIVDMNSVIKPAVIIHTGDIVSILDPASGILARSIINQSGISVKTIAGNHDLTYPENYLYYFGPFNTWFDLGQNRFIGYSTGRLDSNLVQSLLSSTSNKSVIFSHYSIRLPEGSNADPAFYNMPDPERNALQTLLKNYSAPAYLSGHLHQSFLLEDYVSKAVEIGGPDLASKGQYNIITSDNGIISSNTIDIGNWPAIVITSPQRYYPDGGTTKVSGNQKIRAKIYDNTNIPSVLFKIDDGIFQRLNRINNSLWEINQNFDNLTTGVHIISVQALDSFSRTNNTSIQVMVAERPSPTPTPTPTTPPNTILINAGGPGDTGYTDGQLYSVTNPISNTDNQALYRTERYNMAGYRFNVPNGNYSVTLKFAEIYYACNKINCRKFNVDIEGVPVLTDFDIFNVTRALYQAIDYTFNTTVRDGQLNINFKTLINASKISGIQIVPLGGTVIPTPIPTATPTIAPTPTPTARPTVIPTPTPSPSPLTTVMVNAGGPAYGNWKADTGYTDGQTYSVTNPITNTTDQTLYQTERYNMAGYRFNVPNGNYAVTLKFAEIYYMCKENCRVFNVDIENQRVLTNFDIFKETGALYKAVDKTFITNVSDGQLNINFTTIKNASKISGIVITPQ